MPTSPGAGFPRRGCGAGTTARTHARPVGRGCASSDPGTVLGAVDSWQRRHAVAAFPLAVMRKFLDDRASTLAAVIAYYAFFSLFPLLLVFVSVLGFVLQDNASLQEDILDSALARIPVVGDQLRDEVEPLTGSTS